MAIEDILLALYELEKPILQRNDWASLRIAVKDLAAACPNTPPNLLASTLRDLRLKGKILLFPTWEEVTKTTPAGNLCDSHTQWDLADISNLSNDQVAPSWTRRTVFLPENMNGWFLRSRTAELTRLLAWNRERFGLAPSSAHVGYELQARLRPQRMPSGIITTTTRLTDRVKAGDFSRATAPDVLAKAIEIVGKGLQRATGHDTLAAFQGRAWESVIETLFAPDPKHRATMVTAGVSSGKTYAFALPIMTTVVYRALLNQGGNCRALVVYPRTSLVEDQYYTFSNLIAGVNQELAAQGLSMITAKPALDAGQMLGASIGVQGTPSLGEVIPEVAARKTEIILTTSESLKNRMIDCRALTTYFTATEIVVFDEIHLMEGLSGCQGIFLIRRLRQLMRTLRNDGQFEPAWVGASATVAEPVEHCARALSLEPADVRHVLPAPTELERFGTFHHVFVHTRQGKSAISAVTNGLACTTHNRNDSTAHSHYVDPSATPLRPLAGADIPKTITFVDSLSTIGRLSFTTADNERTHKPFGPATPPYYSWFYRPGARLRATDAEVKSIEGCAGSGAMEAVRNWCSACASGRPAFVGKAVLQTAEYSFLRTHVSMDAAAIARATPPGLPERLALLPEQVGNLDLCPFLAEGVCWWSSQDPGARMAFGPGRVFADQNRAIAYTSKTQDMATANLHSDVNDYFVIPSNKLWGEHTPLKPLPVATSTLIASPRIEVGVDFRKVRDGVTHKALRSASSFQQKVGRVGREDGSDSMIITFLAHRTSDAHFAHHPARLIDAQHLDPIPLKADNPDVLKSALFTAVFDFISTRKPGTIPHEGERINIIGTGGTSEAPWEDKVREVAQYLTVHRSEACQFIANAVGIRTTPESGHALDAVIDIFRGLTVDLGGAFHTSGSAARWIFQNQEPATSQGFSTVLQQAMELHGDAVRASAHTGVRTAIEALLQELEKPAPSASALQAGTLEVHAQILAVNPPDPTLFATLGKAHALANAFNGMTLVGSFSDVRFGYEVVKSFFKFGKVEQRRMSLFYFRDVLTTLPPFRQFYPYGMARTQFQHINAKEVTVLLPEDVRETESINTALFELLPGTWNYRWLKPRKSPCGPIEQLGGTQARFANLSYLEARGTIFETTGTVLSAVDVPTEMPQFGPGDTLPILRPQTLNLSISLYQPKVDRATSLVADGDEAPVTRDPSAASCPTLPRAFPVLWYRVSGGANLVSIHSPEDPTVGVGQHEYPALGRRVLEDVSFSTDMKTDTFAYAIDRTYGIGTVDSPRLYYRRGNPHQWVAIGDQTTQTDGLIFKLKHNTLDVVLHDATANPGALRGEIILRALRCFILRETGSDPFQAEMLRKLVLAKLLDSGQRLATLDVSDVQSAFMSMDQPTYHALRDDLIQGLVSGTSGNERTLLKQRYEEWYDKAYPHITTAQAAACRFDALFLREIATDILVHSLAVVMHSAMSSLVGSSDGDMGYFYNPAKEEVYLFDTVEGGNGYAETVRKFLHIPPLHRLLHSRGHNNKVSLPDVDGFQLFEEAIGDCPGQLTTRVVFEATRQGVTGVEALYFHYTVSADLQARVRHEFNSISGSAKILADLDPGVFSTWEDLIWLQVLPERFVTSLQQANVVSGLEELRTRTHICVTGCMECVDNADQSVHGSLASVEHVSRGLLDLLRQHVITNEPASYLHIPAGQSIATALQDTVGQPVLDPQGGPVSVQIDDHGTPRQILLTRVLSTVATVHRLAPTGKVLRPTGAGGYEVIVPFLAAYRDERPLS